MFTLIALAVLAIVGFSAYKVFKNKAPITVSTVAEEVKNTVDTVVDKVK